LVFAALPKSLPRIPGGDYSVIVRNIEDEGQGVFTNDSVSEIEDLIAGVDAVAVGPGLSNNPKIIPVIESLNNIALPVVYDADALNLISANPGIFIREHVSVLTPHPGEMQRLLKGFELESHLAENRLSQAKALALRLAVTVVLKGNKTVIATPDGKVVVNSSGCPALATAGSGDVLTGMIGAWLAKGISGPEAAKISVFLHGLTGEISAYGTRGTIADDLPDLIPFAMKEISPFA